MRLFHRHRLLPDFNILPLLLFGWVLLLSSPFAFSQTTSADTTLFKVVEEMPRFPGCENPDSTIEAKQRCSERRLLEFVNQNIEYPIEAREKGLEGTVVISFVVEKDGSLSQTTIVRNVEGGCGDEAVRVVNLMNVAGLRWVPGKKDGKPVRVQFNLPVKFKLEESLPYSLILGDTVYVEFDKPLEFANGAQALSDFLGKSIKYPAKGMEKCMIGEIDIQLLVYPNNNVRILQMTDYQDLGVDFWFEAAHAAAGTVGKWTPAEYDGRQVASAYDLSISFVPTAPACKLRIEQYRRANKLAEEGETLYNEGNQESGLAKINEAIALFPDHAAFLFMRGQAFLNQNKFAEACADLSKGRQIAMVNWFDNILSVICR
jgi:TonB family protein